MAEGDVARWLDELAVSSSGVVCSVAVKVVALAGGKENGLQRWMRALPYVHESMCVYFREFKDIVLNSVVLYILLRGANSGGLGTNVRLSACA